MPEVNKPPLSIDVSDATLQDGLDLTAPPTGPSTCSTATCWQPAENLMPGAPTSVTAHVPTVRPSPQSLSVQPPSEQLQAGRPHGPSEKPAKPRATYSPEQLRLLQAEFDACELPSKERRDTLASTLQIRARSVQAWFQSRRQLAKATVAAQVCAAGDAGRYLGRKRSAGEAAEEEVGEAAGEEAEEVAVAKRVGVARGGAARGAVAAKGGAATSHATSHATRAIDSLAMVSGHAILLAAEHAATHAPAHGATHASAHAATRASAYAAERVAAKPREGFHWHSLDGSGYGDARGGKLGSQATTALGCSGGAARRVELTPQQLEVLLAHFKVERLPSVETRERLAHELGLSARSVQVWFQNRRQRDPGHVRKPKPVIGRLSIDNALPLVTEREKQRAARSVAQLAPTPTTAQAPPKHLPSMQQTPIMNPPRRSQLPPPQPQQPPQPSRPPQPPQPPRPQHRQPEQPKQHSARAMLSPSSTARSVPLPVGPSVLEAALAAVDALLSSTYAAAAAAAAAADAADAADATTTVGEAIWPARANPNPTPIPNPIPNPNPNPSS